MRLLSASALVACLALAVVSPGCSTPTSAPSADAKPSLVDLTNGVILPTYRAVHASAGALRTTAKALEAAPSATTLAAAQTAWRAARKVWHQSEAFRFGPVKTKEITSAIDFWPARGETIDAFINGTTPITADSFAALGANAKGFQALE